MSIGDDWNLTLSRLRHRFAGRPSAGGPAEEVYDRRRHLPRVLPVGPEDIEDCGEESGRRIVRRLAAALRAERTRGRAGHWTYDLNPHLALMQAYRAERRRLVQLAGARGVR
jgi:hypothetical protein